MNSVEDYPAHPKIIKEKSLTSQVVKYEIEELGVIVAKKFKEFLKGELENYDFLNDIRKHGNTNEEVLFGFFWKTLDDSHFNFDEIEEKYFEFIDKLDNLLKFKP